VIHFIYHINLAWSTVFAKTFKNDFTSSATFCCAEQSMQNPRIIKNKNSEYINYSSAYEPNDWVWMDPLGVIANDKSDEIWSCVPEKVITQRPNFTDSHCDTLGSQKYTYIPKALDSFGFKIEIVSLVFSLLI
jgi:hypothetical protein